MNVFFKKIFLFLFLILYCIPASVFAAGIFFESNDQSFAQNEEFFINVYLDTENEFVNAVEGRIVFPTNLLEVKEIRDGNSTINFWIQKPIEKQEEIIFSGITPGGFLGQKEFLFSVIFRAKKNGDGSIKADEVKVLLNDGNGGEAQVKKYLFDFSISKELNIVPSLLEVVDKEPPEDFKPTIANDSDIFNKKYFLVFTTQDKGLGIDHYEVREGNRGKFYVTESPHLLKYQSLNKRIFVKAIDKAGNERIIIFEPQNHTPWYRQYLLFGIILVITFSFLLKEKWLKYIK